MARCAGAGQFNNRFEVASDLKFMGAVPEGDEKKVEGVVMLDKFMALAIEDRLLRGVEEELLRDKKEMVKSYMQGGALLPFGSGALSAPCMLSCRRDLISRQVGLCRFH